ncbi:hypothetical protein [Oscillatoria sp. FACHB-1406]|uniref:hypothetical protein n=1 Tax=Oscillatoria sp. FACHB-1406 TaxID=2692846 RepID=UPI0016830D13|nr:hypothetical protein [Oscillatoria sp. FACHB-1406]MBD2576825.1 hypothetical protein [Oscillatoria sp. FACHB-1406]
MPTFEAEKDIEREDETEDYIESKYRRFWIYFQDLANIGALDRVSVAQVLEIFQLDEFEEEKQRYLELRAGDELSSLL